MGVARDLAEFPGETLDGTVFRHPFLERDSVGILGDHVTLEQGTGAVHTAPGHGQEDYVIGVENGLPVYCPVDGAGRFYQAEGAPGTIPEELMGKTVWEGNPIVIDILKSAARWRRRARSSTAIRIAGAATIRPSSARPSSGSSAWIVNEPAPERAGGDQESEVEPGMGRGAHRQHDRHAARTGASRASALGRADHRVLLRCVPGAADRSQDSGSRGGSDPRAHRGRLVFNDAAELVGPERSAARTAAGPRSARKATFWTSGSIRASSHLAVLTPENHLPWPADMYLEGGDQYRGWFHSSLLIAVALNGAAPYRATATNGWTLDGEGHALSKSQGAEEVEKVINKYGAELLRLWTASVDFTEDVRFSDTIVSA